MGSIDTDVPAPLDPSILALAEDLPKPPNFDADDKPSEASTPPSGRTLSGQPAPEAPPTEKKVPKWFKMGTSKPIQLTQLMAADLGVEK